jgi:predicted nucleic acid-binding protein
VCGPVVAELLAGTKDDHRNELWLALSSLSWAELDPPAWRDVGDVFARLRAQGEVVPLSDVMIAVAGARAGAAVWTTNRDFGRIAESYPPLELYSGYESRRTAHAAAAPA